MEYGRKMYHLCMFRISDVDVVKVLGYTSIIKGYWIISIKFHSRFDTHIKKGHKRKKEKKKRKKREANMHNPG